MEPVKVRRATDADLEQVLLMDGLAFGVSYSAAEAEFELRNLPRERMLVADDDGLVVGVTASYDSTISVPGGALIAAPGITWVSVRPTHRRRGVLSTMIGEQLRGFRHTGAPASVLLASESGIYGRFGFGVATRSRKMVVDRTRVRMREPADTTDVLVATPAQARSRMPAIYDAARSLRPGMFSRPETWWDSFVEDPEFSRSGRSARHYLLHPEGFAVLRAKDAWDDAEFRNVAHVSDLVATSDGAHAALWAVLLGLDLYARIEVEHASADDPLPHLVDHPRRVETRHDNDGMWLRPLDPAAVLAARTYALPVNAVLGIRDARFGDVSVRLVGGPDGAECVHTEDTPQIWLDVSTVGAVSLGGQRLQRQAGVTGEPDLVRLLDRALLGDVEPNHVTGF